jgi:hypothetical protein
LSLRGAALLFAACDEAISPAIMHVIAANKKQIAAIKIASAKTASQ